MNNYLREPVNGFTHLAGAILSFIGLLALVIKTALQGHSTIALTAVIIFGISMILLYAASATYHLVVSSDKVISFLRRLDHAMIFLLIAGSYTPFCLISMRQAPLWGISGTEWSGWLIFALVWALIALGITMNSVNIKKFSALSMIIYLCAGWLIILNCVELYKVIGFNGFALLLSGGISFSIGSILYGIGKKYSVWFHTVFHFFVSFGIILQFLSVYLYVL